METVYGRLSPDQGELNLYMRNHSHCHELVSFFLRKQALETETVTSRQWDFSVMIQMRCSGAAGPGKQGLPVPPDRQERRLMWELTDHWGHSCQQEKSGSHGCFLSHCRLYFPCSILIYTDVELVVFGTWIMTRRPFINYESLALT